MTTDQKLHATPKTNNSTLSSLALAIRSWDNTPARVKFSWLAGALSVLGLGSLILATAPQAPTILQNNKQGREAYLLSTQTPTALAGITAETPPDVALKLLYESLPQFEQWLNDAQTTHFDQLITIEAQRVAAEAMAEVQKGQVNLLDPASDIDLQTCVTRLQPQYCVLFRYAGDALVQLEAANREGDIYKASNAYIRYRAALLAMAPPPKAVPDAQASLQGLLNYRIAVYDILRLLPQAQPVAREFQNPNGAITPGLNLEQQHPAP